MKLTDLLSGQKILEEVHSKYNGDIEVIYDLTWGKIIKVGGLTQSGGIVSKIWKETLKKVLLKKPHINNCLILGLGGGSAAKLIRQYWVTSQITGVDIDKKIVGLGIKYLWLNDVAVTVGIQDAFRFVQREKTKYDLILVDLYCGDKFPEKFEDERFLENIKKILKHGAPAGEAEGIAIFNRLYGGDHRPDSMRFGKKLEKHFKKVDYMFPQANLMFVCYN